MNNSEEHTYFIVKRRSRMFTCLTLLTLRNCVSCLALPLYPLLHIPVTTEPVRPEFPVKPEHQGSGQRSRRTEVPSEEPYRSDGEDVRLPVQAAADRRQRRREDVSAVPLQRGRLQHHLHLYNRWVQDRDPSRAPKLPGNLHRSLTLISKRHPWRHQSLSNWLVTN